MGPRKTYDPPDDEDEDTPEMQRRCRRCCAGWWNACKVPLALIQCMQSGL